MAQGKKVRPGEGWATIVIRRPLRDELKRIAKDEHRILQGVVEERLLLGMRIKREIANDSPLLPQTVKLPVLGEIS